MTDLRPGERVSLAVPPRGDAFVSCRIVGCICNLDLKALQCSEESAYVSSCDPVLRKNY